MFYKFSNMVGRLVPSTLADSVRPQGLNPVIREPTVISFDSKKTKVAIENPAQIQQATRAASTGAGMKGAGGATPSHTTYKKVMDLQTRLLRQDGLMVWQKTGVDKMGYFIIMGGVVGGLVLWTTYIYKLAFPPKQE